VCVTPPSRLKVRLSQKWNHLGTGMRIRRRPNRGVGAGGGGAVKEEKRTGELLLGASGPWGKKQAN